MAKLILSQWDKSANKYFDLMENQGEAFEELVNNDSVLKLAGNIKGLNVFDAGSGTGIFSDRMRKLGARVIGADGSKKLVNLSKKKHPQVKFFHVDLEKNFASHLSVKKFDVIVSKNVFHFIKNPTKVLKHFYALLKKKGVLVLSFAHPTYWFYYWLADKWGIRKRTGFPDLDGYFEKKKITLRIKEDRKLEVTVFHRPLSYYVNSFIESGFIIERMEEPQPSMSELVKNPERWSYYETIEVKNSKINRKKINSEHPIFIPRVVNFKLKKK